MEPKTPIPRAKRSRPALRTAVLRKPPTAALVPESDLHVKVKEARAARLTVGTFQEKTRAIHRDLAVERTAAERDALAARELKVRLKGVKRTRQSDLMDTPDLLDASSTPRCTATSKQSGERCRRRPHPGANVCVIHGSGSKSVKAAARDRLLAAVDPAIDSLRNIAALAKDAKGLKDLKVSNPRLFSAVVRASMAILDRSGYPATKEYVIGTPEQAKAQMAELLGVRVDELPDDDDPHGERWRSIHVMPMRSAIPSALPPIPISISPDDPAPSWAVYLAATPEDEALGVLAALESIDDAQAALAAELQGAKRQPVIDACLSSPGWTGQASAREASDAAIEPSAPAPDPDAPDPDGWIEV